MAELSGRNPIYLFIYFLPISILLCSCFREGKQLMWTNKYYHFTTSTHSERCRNKIANSVTFVRVMVAPKTVSQIVRTTRVTFSGQLASLGKKHSIL